MEERKIFGYSPYKRLISLEMHSNNKENFESKYIKQDEKSYFLNNVDFIKFYKGNINEFAIVKKK